MFYYIFRHKKGTIIIFYNKDYFNDSINVKILIFLNFEYNKVTWFRYVLKLPLKTN